MEGDRASTTSAGPSAAPAAALTADGSVEPAFRAALDVAPQAYRRMVELRLVSARMVRLQRAGRIASHAASVGEEATVVGAALAAREGDWLFPGAREWGTALVRGLSLGAYMKHQVGSLGAAAKGHAPPDFVLARHAQVVPASGVVGANAPQAVGCAWAAKIRKADVVALALLGDGATSTGDFHNALNFAGVFKAPCVLVCRDNGRATRAAASRVTRSAPSADRALAYGIASARVDGNDALAVLTVVREAVARAVRGEGVTLVEAVTTPLGEALDDARLDRGDVLDLGERDPLTILRRVLEREKLFDAEGEITFAREVERELDRALEAAEAEGPPLTASIFEDVYAHRPPHLAAQERELLSWRR
jgi:pyruvate dehydrogenase E1 component alpha subunit